MIPERSAVGLGGIAVDIVVDLLFWIHLISLVLGGVATFGIPVVGSKLASAPVETRPLLFRIIHQMSTISRVALALLLITGPMMFWLRFGWVAPNAWFWVKMVLVLILVDGFLTGRIDQPNWAESGGFGWILRPN